jgi:hypothetical protein
MQPDRWRIVVRLIDQIQGTAGRLILAVAPQPLDVVLYEVPVLARTQPPHNPLRGFVQEAVALLREPTAADIASFLHLPQVVVDLVLGNLQQVGSVSSDAVGRWTVPDGAPEFRAGGEDPSIWRRTRHLLCLWPEREIMLPVQPRLRLRDLVELGVHPLQGDVRNWYSRFAALAEAEAERRGLPTTVKLLPLSDTPAITSPGPDKAGVPADAPVSAENVLVSQCRLDVIALCWATRRLGVWEVSSRLWCRPTPPEDSDGEPFAPGEPFVGLSLPEHFLGGESHLDGLGALFDPRPDAWRTLLENPDEGGRLHRDLQSDDPTVIVAESADRPESQRWFGLATTLASEARLICGQPSSPQVEQE